MRREKNDEKTISAKERKKANLITMLENMYKKH